MKRWLIVGAGVLVVLGTWWAVTHDPCVRDEPWVHLGQQWIQPPPTYVMTGQIMTSIVVPGYMEQHFAGHRRDSGEQCISRGR